MSARKVVVYELLSLDGVAEEPDVFITAWDDVMEANLASLIAEQDAVILGRRSSGEWSEFWPGSDIQPFSTFTNGVAKYVATSALSSASGPMQLRSMVDCSNSFGN